MLVKVSSVNASHPPATLKYREESKEIFFLGNLFPNKCQISRPVNDPSLIFVTLTLSTPRCHNFFFPQVKANKHNFSHCRSEGRFLHYHTHTELLFEVSLAQKLLHVSLLLLSPTKRSPTSFANKDGYPRTSREPPMLRQMSWHLAGLIKPVKKENSCPSTSMAANATVRSG